MPKVFGESIEKSRVRGNFTVISSIGCDWWVVTDIACESGMALGSADITVTQRVSFCSLS